MTSSLDDIFDTPLPLGTRPRRFRAGQETVGVLWNHEAEPHWLPYRITPSTGVISRLSDEAADGLAVVDDLVYWWSGTTLQGEGIRPVEFNGTVLDVQAFDDERLLIVTSAALLLSHASLAGPRITLWIADDRQVALAAVRQTDADIRTLSEPEPFQLVAPKGRYVAVVSAFEDPRLAVSIVDFCVDPKAPVLRSRSRTWTESIQVWSLADNGLREMDVPLDGRTLNVYWHGDELVLDVLKSDDITRELVAIRPDQRDHHVIWQERGLPWHTAGGRQSGSIDGTLWLVSERSGHARLWEYAETDQLNPLTPSGQEVKKVTSLAAGSYMLSIASGGPQTSYLQTLRGGVAETLSRGLVHDFVETGRGDRLWVESTIKTGWTIYTSPSPGGETPVSRALTTPLSMPLLELEPEFLTLPGPRGPLSAMAFSPSDGGAIGAGVIFIHGNGYAQDVLNGQQPFYWREHLYLRHLAERGVHTITIDYAGSEGYGSEFASSVTGNIPAIELADIGAARAELIRRGVDAARIGIFGGSYAGYLVLAALLLEPGTFACGAALRSVTDWGSHFDCDPIFVRQRFGTDVNSDLYAKAALLKLGGKLQDDLLLAHGVLDDNVPFQQAISMLEAFILSGTSTKVSLALYPTEGHGIISGKAWLDQYTRIDKLFTTRLSIDK